MNINKAIKELKFQTVGMNQKYRPYADQVLNLFKDRKIEKRKEAEKLLDQLAEARRRKLRSRSSTKNTARQKAQRASSSDEN